MFIFRVSAFSILTLLIAFLIRGAGAVSAGGSRMSLIEGRTGSWETVIGMEVHAQVVSESKLFSGASTAFGAEPNAQVSLVDAAMPGMLPVINETLRRAGRCGPGSASAPRSTWSRFSTAKNYFYPDLPQGYQISQFSQPVVGRGARSR